MNVRPLCLLLALTAASIVSAGELRTPPTGEVVDDVRCAGDPRFGYSLYLPSAYPGERRWPVVYLFSPSGRGVEPVRALAPAAERFGYILVGSNEVRNGPWGPVLEAQRALWREVNRAFAVDPQRSYASGFSGGARAAVELALAHRGRFAGLILCGAVFSPQTEYPDGGGLVVVGLVGDGDLNLEEHLRSESLLAATGYRVWQEVFPGPHRWPDADLYAASLELLEVDAMGRGMTPVRPGFVDEVVASRLARARGHDEGGRPLLALHGLRQVERFFPGSGAAAKAKRLAAEWAARPGVAAAQEAEAAYLEDLRSLNERSSYPTFRAAAQRMRERVEVGGPLGERARLALHLASVFLTTTGTELLRDGKLEEAVQALAIAVGVYPPNAAASYNAACALARSGEPEPALEMLAASARARFDDLDLLDRDPALDTLRELPAFVEIRTAVGANRERGLEPVRYPWNAPVADP